MDYKLINYFGIDPIDDCDFQWSFPYLVEDVIHVSEDIGEVLSFSLYKEFISYKVIDIFEDSNLEDTTFYGNLVILNNKFNVNFEYGSGNNNISKLNSITNSLYKSTFVSLDNFNNSTLEVTLLAKDLTCNYFAKNKIFFSANLIIGINEL